MTRRPPAVGWIDLAGRRARRRRSQTPDYASQSTVGYDYDMFAADLNEHLDLDHEALMDVLGG